MPDAARNAGPRRWQEGVEPDLRRRVLEKILGKLAQVYEGMPPPSHDLDRIATSFEQKMFSEAETSMESVEEMDWREDMFQQMKDLKDAYLSELVELDQVSAVPKMKKEEFESLPKDKAEQYRFRVYMKKRIRTMLNFLQFQKSDIPEHLRGQLPMFVKAIHNVLGFYRRKKDQRAEMDTGLQSHISHKKPQIINLTDDPAPSSGYTSQQMQPVQSAALQSTSPSPVAMAGIVKVSSSPASVSTLPSPIKKVETTDLQAEDLQHGRAETPVAKKPIDRLIDAVRSLSPSALMSAANSIFSVISMDDCITHRESSTFQHWTFSEQAGSSPPNNIKRIFEITSLGPESPPLVDTWEVEANVERGLKRQKTQNGRNALLDEIESANRMLMDTITSIADDNRTDGVTSSSGGTLIKLSYTAMSLSADLKSLFDTSEMPIIMPTKLLVPTDYPRSSPVLVTDQRGEQLRNMFSDISSSADVAFRNTLKRIPEPRSIGDTVWAWDTCVRRAVTEFAQRTYLSSRPARSPAALAHVDQTSQQQALELHGLVEQQHGVEATAHLLQQLHKCAARWIEVGFMADCFPLNTLMVSNIS
ncbi:hypothetical protein QOZ80_4AG0327280 [Eleusine coracana subsp. coracana]|nr:hypothetical protein QOZ80_4AG0327280 [Eleusine coracana subsp. coracana]